MPGSGDEPASQQLLRRWPQGLMPRAFSCRNGGVGRMDRRPLAAVSAESHLPRSLAPAGEELLPERLPSLERTGEDVLVDRHINGDRLPGPAYALAGLYERGRQGNTEVSLQVFER